MEYGFFGHLLHYSVEVGPALLIGLVLSGIVNELVPDDLIKKHLGKGGLIPILSATAIGTILPVCCMGSLPIAISFHKKGARLGPTLAFLVAAPATSITAMIVSFRILGLFFTVYLGLAVVVLGLVMGVLGDLLNPDATIAEAHRSCCSGSEGTCSSCAHGKTFKTKLVSIFKYSFIEMPRRIGIEVMIGLILAATVASIAPVGELIKTSLSGWVGYPFSLVFGLIMYICSTASVPLVHAFTQQGMNIGAGMLLLMVGPITSYGALLVVRKHFGNRVLAVYLTVISLASLLLGISYSVIFGKLGTLLPAWIF